MHKIIVVEDDRIIRRGICQSIAWGEQGFIVAGEAGDGEIALELIKKEQPHIVISDINMPFMNGLEMAKRIRDISPHTKVIFLTGYEDFKYAHEAVKLRVYDYLLKPVDSELLLEKVKEAAKDWEQTTSKEKKLMESVPLLEQRFFRNLTKEGERRVDVEKEMAELGIRLEGPNFAVLLIHFSTSDDVSSKSLYQLIKETTATLDRSRNCTVMNVSSNEFAILFSLESETDSKKGRIAEELFYNLTKKTEYLVTITLGRTYPNYFEIGQSFIESRLAMDMRHIMGTGRVFSIEDTVSSKELKEDRLTELELELENQLKLGLPEKVTETLNKLGCEIVERKTIPLSDLKILALKFSTMLFVEIDKWRKENFKSSYESNVYKNIIQMKTLTEMIEILQNLIQQWSTVLYKQEEKIHYSHVDQAINYMRENFHDSSLTLQQVADLIHVSTPYLSNLFKLEKGFNFGEYLLELRMKKAMELLRKGNVKTYEVCETVGYSNPQYFSICFKKYTGYTPAEYKKQFK